MNSQTLSKLIVVHNTLYQLKVSGEQTAPVAQCILTLQDIIGQAQKELPMDAQETDKPTEEENENENGENNEWVKLLLWIKIQRKC